MTVFSNPRLAAEPCELMRGCSFAENFVTAATILNNAGTESGAGGTFDAGATFAGNGYVEFDVVTQPSGFSVTVQFETTTTVTTRGPLISNATAGTDGFWIYLTPTGILAQHGNGAELHTACEIALDYADGDIHAVTYVVDMTGGTHTLYIDDDSVSESTAINEEIGTTNAVTVGNYSTSRFRGTIYEPRIFNAVLTESEHDMYYVDRSPTAFWTGTTALAKYKMDAFGDDSVGHYIWDATLNLEDLTKGDGATSTTFPTFDADKYLFDYVDDYVTGWPTLGTNYTVTAALSTPQEPYPTISQTNDTTLMDLLDTSAAYWGYVHNLSIYPIVLNQLQLYHAEYMHMYWLERRQAVGAYMRLMTEGTCKLAVFMDSDYGVYTNMAPLHDAGIATLVTRGTTASDGCTFGSATSNVEFEHNSEYNCADEITIVLYGSFILNGVSPAQTFVDKGGNYKFRQNGLDLDFNGSTYTGAADTYDQIAVTIKDGFEPRFYLDGEFAGEGTTTETLTADTTELTIGNNNELNERSQSAIKQASIYDKALSDREIQALYEEARSIGATTMEVGPRRKSRRAPAVGAVAETIDPGDHFQLIDVEVEFSSAPTTSEDFTIVATNSDSDEYALLTVDPSSPAVTKIRFVPEQGQGRFIDGTTIGLAYTNTDGRTITTNTTYQLDESVTA